MPREVNRLLVYNWAITNIVWLLKWLHVFHVQQTRTKRDHCISEMIETERNYVDVLNMLLCVSRGRLLLAGCQFTRFTSFATFHSCRSNSITHAWVWIQCCVILLLCCIALCPAADNGAATQWPQGYVLEHRETSQHSYWLSQVKFGLCIFCYIPI